MCKCSCLLLDILRHSYAISWEDKQIVIQSALDLGRMWKTATCLLESQLLMTTTDLISHISIHIMSKGYICKPWVSVVYNIRILYISQSQIAGKIWLSNLWYHASKDLLGCRAWKHTLHDVLGAALRNWPLGKMTWRRRDCSELIALENDRRCRIISAAWVTLYFLRTSRAAIHPQMQWRTSWTTKQ